MSIPGPRREGGEQPATIVLRPRMVRVFAYLTGVIVLAGMIGGAIAITTFSLGGRVALVVIGGLVLLFCHLEASVRIIARPARLEVRNLMRTRTVEWAEIITISFPMGDPWAHLDLADGSTLQLQALQRYDGEHAISGARLLRDLVRQRGEAAESPEA